jgi:hypothetical protein
LVPTNKNSTTGRIKAKISVRRLRIRRLISMPSTVGLMPAWLRTGRASWVVTALNVSLLLGC